MHYKYSVTVQVIVRMTASGMHGHTMKPIKNIVFLY